MIITVCSTKGGVGKTTLTANLGAILADFGKRVLLLDADPQPTLSSYFNLAEKSGKGLVEFLTCGEARGVVSRTAIRGLDLIYSNDPDGQLRDWIRDAVDGRVRLKFLLNKLTGYDVILVDTQGAVGPLQDAAVAAADLLLSPIPPEILSAREFVRGTLAMLERLKPMALMGAPIGPLRGLLYRMDRTADARQIAQELRSASYGPSKGAITILDTAIPATVVYRESATQKIPAHRLEKRRKGPTASALESMTGLARELFPDLPLTIEADHG